MRCRLAGVFVGAADADSRERRPRGQSLPRDLALLFHKLGREDLGATEEVALDHHESDWYRTAF
jgi:hypothetical protein